ncbi:ABC transporter substrate-binding protein [Saccharopolyspora sp. K220]|uniref:ABC transporter substrate-binding protein n=1 Tax=Saccharopolyspora soli TaxID=2926618 RepID=UPI001F55C560|nr:ABC transporter substrate-binding protein [Saccharopolyspora soli]MCI2416368.1 ABC transporter substrate-binding protein [Saccharopolyspora soli]
MTTLSRRQVLRGGLLAASALPLLACAPGASEQTGQPANLRVADQNGGYRSQLTASQALNGTSYQVQWSDFPAAQPLLEAIRAGACDVGIAGDAPTLTAFAAKAPIKVIGVLHRNPTGTAILVPANSPVASVTDLRGKSISPTTRGSIGHYLVLKALERDRLAPDSVTFNFLQPTEARTAFESGNITAWSTWDPYTAAAQVSGARVLTTAEGLSAGHTYLVAAEEALEDQAKRAALADLVGRYKQAWDWTNANRDAYAKIYAENTGISPAASELIQNRSPFTAVPIDDSVVAALQAVAADYRRAGFLPQEVNVDPLFERSLA